MKRNTKKIVIGAVVLALVGVVAFIAPQVVTYGYLTTRATARIACPMIYLEGRDKDFALTRMHNIGLLPFDPRGPVTIKQDDAEKSIKVRVYGMFEAYSIYYPGEGCVLQ